MWLDFNFQHDVVDVYRQIEYGHGQDTQTYIFWVERLTTFYYWMAYHAVRWPTDLVSLCES